MAQGGSLNFEQTRVNDEVWLPSRASIRADARVIYVKKLREEMDITYRDYRKFRAIRASLRGRKVKAPKKQNEAVAFPVHRHRLAKMLKIEGGAPGAARVQ